MSKYQVLCYCSLAKPDPHTKSKTLVSQDRYGIVFMHGQNVIADISAQFQPVHLDPRSLLGLTTTLSPLTPSYGHLTITVGPILRWHSSLSVEVTKNANLGYSHDRGLS